MNGRLKMRDHPLSDAVFYWLSDHPRATGFILAAVILGVGYFDGPRP
jgi:hypothetical protein